MTNQINNPPINIIGNRYIIQHEIGRGGMGAVYAVTDRLTNELVALKSVLEPTENLLFASMTDQEGIRLSLAKEFKFLSTLRHPQIISVLDYGFDTKHQPYFTMELLNSPQTLIEVSRGQSLEFKIDLIVQVLQALVYLHRRGILHRDLKPANIAVTDGQVRVLDFGLSIARDQKAGKAFEGTLMYSTPEQVEDRPISELTDLYITGIILYEMLAEVHPFNLESIYKLLEDVVKSSPDYSRVKAPDGVVNVLRRMMAYNPEERFQSAYDIIAALMDAMGRPLPVETKAIRESFIQAARLVGREEEIRLLSENLTLAMQGHGNSILIGGESGIGKSRLMDELRSLAMVEGAIVIQGQAISTGAAPYQIWRSALRELCLAVPLTDLEASILKILVPDIANLLDRPIPDAPHLDARALQGRLISVVEQMFQSGKQPIVVLMEDLHWASDDSLTLLQRVTQLARDLPVWILGTYRNDERPDLPEILPQMDLMSLEPFTTDEIAALSVSMLGEQGDQSHLVSVLQRESEGNVFFIVEVVRALAEEAGNLSEVAEMTIPDNIFAQGIQTILTRRLEHVSEAYQPLLNLAAVAGRRIDLPVLEALNTHIDLVSWLNECADYLVLEVKDNIWQFRHDKLRQALLDRHTADETRDLNHQVAEAIEIAHPDDDTYAASLAYHWSQAENPAKEAYYRVLTGEQALRTGAYQEAVNYLERALSLSEQYPQLDIQRANAHRLLAEANRGLGRLQASCYHYEQSLAEWGYPAPHSLPKIFAGILAGALYQVAYHTPVLNRVILRQQTEEKRQTLENASFAASQLAEIHYFANRAFESLLQGIRGFNLSAAAGESPSLAVAYSTMGIVLGTMRLRPLARFYRDKGWEIGRRLKDDDETNSYLAMTANVYNLGVADWVYTEDQVLHGIRSSEKRGDWRLKGMNQIILGDFYYYRAKPTMEVYEELEAIGNRSGDSQIKAWGLIGQARSRALRGEFEPAINDLQRALMLIDKADLVSNIRIYGLLALIYSRLGQWQASEANAEKALASMGEVLTPNAAETVTGYQACMEAFYRLQKSATSSNKRAHYKKRLGKAFWNMQQYNMIFELGYPSYFYWRGVYLWDGGKQNAALKLWERGINHAKRFKLPFYQAELHYIVALHLSANDPQRAEHIKQAKAILGPLNATYYLDLLAELESA